MADGVSKEAGEAQRALVQVRTQHSDLCAEQEKIRFMKQEYISQLKAAEDSQEDLQQSTQLRRFMGQLDHTTRAITDQMAELQRQQQAIAARFRELNSERIKFKHWLREPRISSNRSCKRKIKKNRIYSTPSALLHSKKRVIRSNRCHWHSNC